MILHVSQDSYHKQTLQAFAICWKERVFSVEIEN